MEKVPWLEKGEISLEAEALLERWAVFSGQAARPPIPVEAIIEKYLGFVLEYDNLAHRLGIPDVLGATWVDDKLMVIDESLLEKEGRMGFTCGHEIAHWTLHRRYIKSFNRGRVFICRVSNAKAREEWQADYFSSCLIMPFQAVKDAYHRALGPDPIFLDNEKSCFGRKQMFLLDPSVETAKNLGERVIRAGNFSNVSREAMCYRLEEMGLIINRTRMPLVDFFRRRPIQSSLAKR